MQIPFFQVDAFSVEVFGGNPAVVCILDHWLDRDVLQNIAGENNLSETAFLVPISPGNYDLKWFTPTLEIDLCGHATLASAFILFKYYDLKRSILRFKTASGDLSVVREGELLCMDFPARSPVQIKPPEILAEALGFEASQVLAARDLLAVFEEENMIQNMTPDFAKIKEIKDHFAIIVTAPGKNADFVSRFFAPNAGVNEDPVTGSAHCTLVPYWAKRLHKNKLHAFQLSSRKGELFCEYLGDRVKISGYATLFAKGNIYI
ncbi:MAG: PhzF family phenazine biosynthesis protein [Proteobacteria bacterium]|nr:PhzF family phenazine biosynthesis protein [Pseudomonadota bacterium]MBU1714607.1 PhzF family phenazine biosynthesis protein [Pseudomonadota bacterium]